MSTTVKKEDKKTTERNVLIAAGITFGVTVLAVIIMAITNARFGRTTTTPSGVAAVSKVTRDSLR
jgi:hypothetical protein